MVCNDGQCGVLLWRVQSSLKLHVVEQLPGGSYLSRLMTDVERQRIRRHRGRSLDTPPEGIVVRVVEHEVSNRDSDQTGPIRVITTRLDHEQVSARPLPTVSVGSSRRSGGTGSGRRAGGGPRWPEGHYGETRRFFRYMADVRVGA
ncbi:hypothetical protein [Nocardia gipuzkoensis]|uniref:hypothetical protein n=1 Tax=Nocardia gipuzkoensis TaxID=2749991 RepID=UPI003EE2CF4F